MWKVDKENWAFNPAWTEEFMFILPVESLKLLCLICTEMVAVDKSLNVERHYETKHKITFEKSYPLNSAIRISNLKAIYLLLGLALQCPELH